MSGWICGPRPVRPGQRRTGAAPGVQFGGLAGTSPRSCSRSRTGTRPFRTGSHSYPRGSADRAAVRWRLTSRSRPPRPDRVMDFNQAYDVVLAKWPVPVEPVDVGSPYGTTRVNVCGRADGEPLVLLHGGGATSTVWFANVGDLSRTHRVYAVDQINDAGRSVAGGRPLRSGPDLMAWLDALLTGLGLDAVRLCGHSYGGWLALNYALHAPQRVTHLALLDPTLCFAGMRLSYRLHAIPLFLPGPRAAGMRAFLRWETGGV